MDKAKPFDIPKREVWEAFKKVKANQGAAGVDGQSVADFEANLSNNLYKLWNRMSSGSYLPPPVRRVNIPKGDSKTETRPLGIPTVADRIAQEVVKRYLEPILEPICEFARNTDPLRADFASKSDPSDGCVSILPHGPEWPGRILGDGIGGPDRQGSARIF